MAPRSAWLSSPAPPAACTRTTRPGGQDRQGRDGRRGRRRRASTAAQAAREARPADLQPLERPIVVHHDRSTWTLGAREARIAVDVDAIVDEALARSREGNILARTVRDVTGKSLDADVQPSVTYSDAAVVRLLDKIRAGSTARPVDATAKLSAAGISTTDSRTGLAVRASALHRQITQRDRVDDRRRARSSPAPRKLRPKVTTADLEQTYGTAIVVNRAPSSSRSTRTSRSRKTYTIAVGQVGPRDAGRALPHPEQGGEPGLARAEQRLGGRASPARSIPAGAPDNPLKARWMGIFDGAGIHGTDAIGSLGTRRLARLRPHAIPDVIDLYDRVPVGAPIYIA